MGALERGPSTAAGQVVAETTDACMYASPANIWAGRKKNLSPTSREVPETTVFLPFGRILEPPLPGQGWLAELSLSLDAIINIYPHGSIFKMLSVRKGNYDRMVQARI